MVILNQNDFHLLQSVPVLYFAFNMKKIKRISIVFEMAKYKLETSVLSTDYIGFSNQYIYYLNLT